MHKSEHYHAKGKPGLFITLWMASLESPDQWQFNSLRDDDMMSTMTAHQAAEDTILLGAGPIRIGHYWPTATDEPYVS